MPWTYMMIIAILGSFIFYTLDQINKMAHDVKYIRKRVDQQQQPTGGPTNPLVMRPIVVEEEA